MNYQKEAAQIITEYLKPIYGFALKKCKNLQDAEDLSQDIACKAYKALLIKDDIEDVSKFIWTIAHNALSNYYRANAKSIIGVSIDEVADLIADPNSLMEEDDNAENIKPYKARLLTFPKHKGKSLSPTILKIANRKKSLPCLTFLSAQSNGICLKQKKN